ncbi:sensor histidine kinase [Dictyobacter formicarum]|uniref:sensor histidine kinase n=1 Tax=Dictyobacter formicarum TaxID=2778368 RepID=UPI0019169C9A|nr:HAMP domain-containing sensor histidine kinase [Dictyobacter formicarum]
MRYPNALARFLLSISISFQISLVILSALVSSFLLIYTPWVGHNPIIYVVPVMLSAWLFRRTGLYLCLLFLFLIFWLFHSMVIGSLLLSNNDIIATVVSVFILLTLGLLVSAQREASDYADDVQEQLQTYSVEQQKLNEIKDQFLQNVNHELRTPLTAIYGYLELLLEHDDQLNNEIRTTFLQHAMQSCDELQLLVNNVLDTMGIEKQRQTLYIEQIVVRDVLFEVLERFDPQSVRRHDIYVDIPDYVVVLANAQYLRQILRNLLSNAFKYAPAGTPITISAALYGMVVHPLHASPEICVRVKDAGPGIPPNEMSLLFGQFVRLRRDTSGSVRGSGLGLFLSKQFVEAMDGRIWVESEGIEGKGSTFCFTLPCVVHPKVEAQTPLSDFEQFRSPLPIN